MTLRKFLLGCNTSLFVLLLNFQFFKYNLVFQIFLAWVIFLIPLYHNSFCKIFLKNKKIIIYSTIWILPLIISSFYSKDIIYGLKQVQKSLLLLIFPVVIFSLPKEAINRFFKLTIKFFPISTLFFIAYIYIKLLFFWYDPYLIQYGKPNTFEYIQFVYNHRFSYLLEGSDLKVVYQFVHKAYISIFILISILLVDKWRNKYLKVFLQLTFFLLLVLFKGKTQIFIGGFLFIFLVCKLLNNQKIIIYIYGGLLLLALVNIKLITDTKGYSNRLEVAKCSKEIVIKNLFFGVGIGDVQKKLNNCYEEKLLKETNNLNTHNYYMHILISSGILGLLFFAYSFLNLIKISFSGSKDFFIILFIILFSLIFENLFVRMWGCISYGLFGNLILSYKMNNSL